MINAKDFLTACKTHQFDFFSGTPCSYLKPFINAVIDDPEVKYYDATNEGDAVAMVSGAYVSGRKGLVMFQNSGFGNAVNALTSLSHTFRVPFILIITHRGQPDGSPDEPQHELMGQITEELLNTLRIRWEYFPQNTEEIAPLFSRIREYMSEFSLPYALVMREGSIEPQELKSKRKDDPIGHRDYRFEDNFSLPYNERSSRTEALKVITDHLKLEDIVIATTGKTGRELYTLKDASNHLYMVGSMGSASSFALGLALNRPDKRILMLDGDGAFLMRMGNAASVGAFKPKNYLHLVLDNEAHDSTGGQPTVSNGVSLGLIGKACGYRQVYSSDQLTELDRLLASQKANEGPTLIHFKIKKGSPKDLGRPKIKPYEVKDRLMKHLGVQIHW
ncbi:MAG TPA: phosphonopyruvate decarboxylase [Spirochaetes bacterium]|nr:phosphonopyruvate decarboxylase [Spirochaetota bacterium]